MLLSTLLEAAQNASEISIAAIMLTALLFLHLQRKDYDFLRKLDIKPFYIFLVEYHIFTLPISLLLFLLLGKWLAFILIHIGLFGIAWIPPLAGHRKLAKSFRLNFLPVEAFELKAGIRQYWYVLGLFYFPGIALAKFVAAPLISIVLFGLMGASFYEQIESRVLAEQFYFNTNWLAKKSWIQIRVFLLLHMPHSIAFLIFHSQLWYLLLVALLAGILLLLFAMYYKYAGFLPNRTRVYNQTAFGFYIIGFLIPFFFPVSLFYLVLYYQRAKKRLNYFYQETT